MYTTLQTLIAHVAGAARRAFDGYLPSSPLTGLGQAGELAAQHPAFAPSAVGAHRSA
jgi:predicted lipid-binding transport protein (Tim44 family)